MFILIIFILILSESIKKTLRGLLYLNFKNKFNMILEIGALLAYVATIWGVYAVTGTITVNLIFVTMTITSVISSIILLFYAYKIYTKLPEDTSVIKNILDNIFDNLSNLSDADNSGKTNLSNTKNLQYKILKTRAINFANQFTHNMFSSNFLVPFFALQFGLAQAGIFKLLSHITYTVTMIMRKIFGWASDTMLAHTKNLDLESKQDMFHNINNKINNIMLVLVIFLTINLTKIITYTNANSEQAAINWPLIYFFLAITLIENLFISYEKFYIAEERNGVILAINALSILTLSVIIFYANFFEQLGQLGQPGNFSSLISLTKIPQTQVTQASELASQFGQYMLLFLITATRATFFIILVALSFYKWRIKPKFIIKPIYLLLSLVISLAVFKFL
jgi:hypothetical protein